MEPEEIDKIFKDRLNGLPVIPSADAWMRLQQKIEPPKKERTMWIYYAAASVLILLVSGLLLFRNSRQETATTIAQTRIKAPAEKNIQKIPATQATPETPAASTSETESIAQADNTQKEKAGGAGTEAIKLNIKPEAFRDKNKKQLARKMPEKEVKKIAASKTNNTPAAAENVNETQLALQDKQSVIPEASIKAFTAASPEAGNVVQVLIKRDAAADQVDDEAEETDLRENITRKGILIKNLYKQARNLKNGEPVELATLGLDTEKINTEKENIKQKLNKVISL